MFVELAEHARYYPSPQIDSGNLEELKESLKAVQEIIKNHDWESLKCIFVELTILFETLPIFQNKFYRNVGYEFLIFYFKESFTMKKTITNKGSNPSIETQLALDLCKSVENPELVYLIVSSLCQLFSHHFIPQLKSLVEICQSDFVERSNTFLPHCNLFIQINNFGGWLLLALKTVVERENFKFQKNSQKFWPVLREKILICKQRFVTELPNLQMYPAKLIMIATLCEK